MNVMQSSDTDRKKFEGFCYINEEGLASVRFYYTVVPLFRPDEKCLTRCIQRVFKTCRGPESNRHVRS